MNRDDARELFGEVGDLAKEFSRDIGALEARCDALERDDERKEQRIRALEITRAAQPQNGGELERVEIKRAEAKAKLWEALKVAAVAMPGAIALAAKIIEWIGGN